MKSTNHQGLAHGYNLNSRATGAALHSACFAVR
jgi:hypothetical protein